VTIDEMKTSESEYQNGTSYSTFLKLGIIGSFISIVWIFMLGIGYSSTLFQDFIFVYLLNITSYSSKVLLITGVAGLLLRYRSKYALPVVFLYLVYDAITQHLSLGVYSFYLFVALNLIIGIMLLTIRNDVQNYWLLYGVSSMLVLRSLIPYGIRLLFNMVYSGSSDFIAAMIWWSPTLIAHTIYCILIILLLYSEIRPGFFSRKS
jgi:hypothetical protein